MSSVRHFSRLIALACVLMGVAGCASEPLPSGGPEMAVIRTQEYLLGPGDKIRITVFGEDALSGEYLVSNNGLISLPLAGDIVAGGLTPSALQLKIKDTLEQNSLVQNAKVSADVVAYRPFYILGEVARPGQYPFVAGMTLTKAVASAGGFTYRANDRTVYVTREGGTREMPVALTAASAVGPGDTIRVAERHF
ncbi:MAG: polysaccharide export protein [Alphaproteobacteria bacterium]|nr:polysaccharide export protein [Alphaproteobacteria bacterium]